MSVLGLSLLHASVSHDGTAAARVVLGALAYALAELSHTQDLITRNTGGNAHLGANTLFGMPKLLPVWHPALQGIARKLASPSLPEETMTGKQARPRGPPLQSPVAGPTH